MRAVVGLYRAPSPSAESGGSLRRQAPPYPNQFILTQQFFDSLLSRHLRERLADLGRPVALLRWKAPQSIGDQISNVSVVARLEELFRRHANRSPRLQFASEQCVDG